METLARTQVPSAPAISHRNEVCRERGESAAVEVEATMPETRKVEIHKQTRLFDDFFKIDEIVVAHEQRDGTMSDNQRRLVFERGDAVAALLYEPDTHSVIMVDQFKVPTLIARRRDNPATTDGWITEAVAGMIDQGETAEEAIIRETLEETGYRIQQTGTDLQVLLLAGRHLGTHFSLLFRGERGRPRRRRRRSAWRGRGRRAAERA